MAVMYSDLPHEEKVKKLKESTVNEKKNSRVNATYVTLLTILILGYIAINYIIYFKGHDDETHEQEIISNWLGSVPALWWLIAGFSILRVILSITLFKALLNFWRAFYSETASQTQKLSPPSDRSSLNIVDVGEAMNQEEAKQKSQCTFCMHLFVYLVFIGSWVFFGIVL